MPTVVDGGYLSWTYGYNAARLAVWEENCVWYQFDHMQRVLLLDSIGDSFRVQYDPNYKSRRRDKRSDDPIWDDKSKHVVHFRRYILETDDRYKCFRVEGFEADDLIALAAWMTKEMPLKVVGVDKDFLQIPFHRIEMSKVNGERVTLDNYRRRIAKCLQPLVHHQRHLLVCLAALGDKSDSIPRLVPPGQLRILVRILRDSRPLTAAYSQFGEPFLHNLYMAVLPGPWCFDPLFTPRDVFDIVRAGEWPPILPSDPTRTLTSNLLEWVEGMRQTGFLL